MQQQNSQQIGDLLLQFLRENNLEQQFLERRIPEIWPQILGTTVTRYTGDMYVKNGVLLVHITSAPLRQELFQCRFQLVQRINDALGSQQVISDIRLLA